MQTQNLNEPFGAKSHILMCGWRRKALAMPYLKFTAYGNRLGLPFLTLGVVPFV